MPTYEEVLAAADSAYATPTQVDTPNDFVGSNNGVWTAPISYEDGPNGRVFEFAAPARVETALQIPAATDDDFAVMFTFRADDFATYPILLSKGWQGGGPTESWVIYLHSVSNRLMLRATQNDGNDREVNGPILASSTWYRAVIGKTGGNLRVEVLDVGVASNSCGNLRINAENLSIGYGIAQAQGFRGEIGEVFQFADRWPSDEEIDAYFAGPIPTYEEVIAAALVDLDFTADAADTVVPNNAGANATLLGGKTTAQVSVAGSNSQYPKAFKFHGTGDYIDCDTTGLPSGASEATYLVRCRPDAFGSGTEKVIFGVGGVDANGRQLVLFAEDGAFSIGFYAHRVISPKTTYSAGDEVTAMVVVPAGATDTSDVQLWLDGVQQTLALESGTVQTLNVDNTQLLIGADSDSGSEYGFFNGRLDSFFAWDSDQSANAAVLAAGPTASATDIIDNLLPHPARGVSSNCAGHCTDISPALTGLFS